MRSKHLHIAGVLGWIMAILLGGCDRRPAGVLSDSRMRSLMTDLLLADAYSQSANSSSLPDSVRRNLGEAVLKKHGVDRATLDSTFAWYSVNLDYYHKMYADVEKDLRKRQRKIRGGVESVIENDIWPLPKHLELVPNAYGSVLTFLMPGETLAGGEQLQWRMRLNGQQSVDVFLGIDYDNGMTSFVRREFNGGHVDLSLVADSSLTAKRVFGFISSDPRNLPVRIDSISLAKNPFDSIAYNRISGQRRIFYP